MFKVVLDTNVIISAIHNPDNKPALVLSIALSEKPDLVTLYISKEVLAEYKEVLSRNKFKYFNKAHVKSLLVQIRKFGKMVEPSVPVNAIRTDPADNRILECALTAEADFVVTGNTKHFSFKKFRNIRIVSPQEFLVILGEAVL